MGRGKTTAILEYMVENPGKKFLYITPLLSESETRIANTEGLEISIPQVCKTYKTKSAHALSLLEDGKSISTTHALYEHLTFEHLALIKEKDYIVVVDEQLAMLKAYKDLPSKDIQNLLENKLITVEDGAVKWIGPNPLERYASFKNRCDLGRLHTSNEDKMVTEQLPIKLITSANRVILCTYLFYGNVLERFLTMHGITFKKFTDKGLLPSNKALIRGLINPVGSNAQLKKVADFSLSYRWYASATAADLKEIAKAITNISRSCGALKADVCWTVPKVNTVGKRIVKPVGYPAVGLICPDDEDESIDETESTEGIKQLARVRAEAAAGCYLPCSAIATNLYKERTTMIHCINRHPNVVVFSYMKEKGFEIDKEVFALSELVQWIYRSAIRDGKPINLCIMSKPMRDRFNKWLDSDE